jgi:integrase
MKILKNLNPNVAPQTISVYTRHKEGCLRRGSTDEQKAAAKYEKRCKCPKWIYLFHNSKDYRFSAKTRTWEKAEELAREVKDWFDPAKRELRELKQQQKSSRVPIADAVDKYLSDARARHLAPATLQRFVRVFQRQLLPWTEEQGLLYLDELTTPQLTNWRSSWKLAPITSRVVQEFVNTFLEFCVRQDWVNTNPVSRLTRIIVKHKPTDYFSRDQFQQVLDATYSFGNGSKDGKAEIWSERIRALLLLMRWSGLRISDAVTLERSRLAGNKIVLYQAKTGTPVSVVLPPQAADALRHMRPAGNPHPRYFFWNGVSRRSAIHTWQRSFRRLFTIADIRNPDGTPKRSHPHMLRDTFAVEHLLTGMPIDQVSMLLGHSSVKVTEKHYAPWVAARQQQLEDSTLKSLEAQGVLGAAPGTSFNAASAAD